MYLYFIVDVWASEVLSVGVCWHLQGLHFATEIASTVSTAGSTDLHGLQLYKAYTFTTETADDCQVY